MSLPWAPHRDGFLAYPEGDNRRTRYAVIGPELQPSQRWLWRVALETASMSGVEEHMQGARDAAEAAWLKLVRGEWEDQMLDVIYRAQASQIGPADFNFATVTWDDLRWMSERIEKRPPSPGLTKLSDAISSEFIARRSRGPGVSRPVR